MDHNTANNTPPFQLLTAREAARYLRVSLSTLYRMEQQGSLTPLRTPGGHRRYTPELLNACLQKPAPPKRQPAQESAE